MLFEETVDTPLLAPLARLAQEPLVRCLAVSAEQFARIEQAIAPGVPKAGRWSGWVAEGWRAIRFDDVPVVVRRDLTGMTVRGYGSSDEALEA